MNKKNNRKGFTIVELVIVIAVIAILATVLVPTFGNVIDKANKSAARQDARNDLTEYYIDNAEDSGSLNAVVKNGKYFFAIANGNFKMNADDAEVDPGQLTIYENVEDALEAIGEGYTLVLAEGVTEAQEGINQVEAPAADDDETPADGTGE